MATQHPDNASVPWWRSDAFIPSQDEIEELVLLFSELSINEYMWDWEGKFVDEGVAEKLYSRAAELFTKHPLGEDLHLTYRIPAFEGTSMHRMARAFMNVLSFWDIAREIGVKNPPVTEMFLPLTTSAEQPLKVRSAFKEVAQYHRNVFHSGAADDLLISRFRVTPLVEDVPSLLNIEKIVEPYFDSLIAEKAIDPALGQRVFLARSDPAMNAGLIPAVLAVKVALSTLADLSEKKGFPVHPIIGTGSLPFRGSANPRYTDTFLEQYAGVRTYSIQSAFRYDFSKDVVEQSLKTIQEKAPKLQPLRLSHAEREQISAISELFSAPYRATVEALAQHINHAASFTPPRRERRQHIGLFGYSRGIGAVRLPRAIGFTAAFYSMGVPPEFLATGRGLKLAKEHGLLETLLRFYPTIASDMRQAGKYLNRENVEILAKRETAWADVLSDITLTEEILGIELGPQKPRHTIHRNLTSTILHRMDATDDAALITRDVVEAAVIRRSLG
jgi:phosphoenolpyruvate carboxylase